MKKIITTVVSIFWLASALCQNQSIGITTDKTTTLVFPFPIRHVDRGTQDVLAQQVKESNNILLIKAAIKGFAETNLSVVTDDGSVYAFDINYNPKPTVWVYNLPANKSASIATYANGILDNSPVTKGIVSQKGKIRLNVQGIYTREDISYFQIEIENRSDADYDIDILRLFIQDKHKARRTASQETELYQLLKVGNYKKVKAKENTMIVVAVNRFTIPDAKYMGIQILERNGGRHFIIKIPNKKIMKAIRLPDLL